MQFDEDIVNWYGVGYRYRPDNGNVIFFDLSQSPAIPLKEGHPFELVKVDRNFKYIDRGNGRRDYFKNRDYIGWDNLLYEQRYSDGYGIRIDRDAAHRTAAIFDEKGQRAEFIYQDDVEESGEERDLIEVCELYRVARWLERHREIFDALARSEVPLFTLKDVESCEMRYPTKELAMDGRERFPEDTMSFRQIQLNETIFWIPNKYLP
jgi:hypothetical protein